MSRDELAALLRQTTTPLLNPALVGLVMTRGQALWLIDVGLAEVGRNPGARPNA